MSVGLPRVLPALPPVPDGWYAAALAGDLRPGQMVTRPMFGRELVVYRTASGAVGAMDSTCPHLGARMSGGKVCGENVRCPFHAFEYDRDGACVRTPYASPPPRRARARVFPAVERAGFVLVWSGRSAPTWEVPPLDDAGWSPPAMRTFRLRGHPQETTENSVDIGHFGVVHGFENVTIEAPLVLDGPKLTTAYAMRHGPVLGVPGTGFRAKFRIEAWGLGYSFVEVEALDMLTRNWVLSTPAVDGHIDLSLGASVPEPRLPFASGRLVSSLLARALRRLVLELFVVDTRQDFPIWSTKEYLPSPVLAKGDGPVGRYREWAAQFHPRPSSELGLRKGVGT